MTIKEWMEENNDTLSILRQRMNDNGATYVNIEELCVDMLSDVVDIWVKKQ